MLGKTFFTCSIELSRFNKAKHKMLRLSQGTPRCVYRQDLESRPAEEDLGVPVDEKPGTCRARREPVRPVPSSIRRGAASGVREGIVRLSSALVWPQWEYCCQASSKGGKWGCWYGAGGAGQSWSEGWGISIMKKGRGIWACSDRGKEDSGVTPLCGLPVLEGTLQAEWKQFFT